jgi:Skp family chaperone for outer membrane proteins
MTLSERSRATIFQHLEPLLGEEATEEMLSHFPARDVEEPASKEFIRAELAISRAEVQAEIGALRQEVQAEIGGLRQEVQAEIGGLRQEMQAEIGGLRTDLYDKLESFADQIHREQRQMLTWLMSTIVGTGGLIIGVTTALAR